MDGIVSRIDASLLRATVSLAPKTKQARQNVVLHETAALLPDLLQKFAIDTELRIAHFLAQIGHECDNYCTTREYASGAAYEGRTDLGNTRPGDGRRFCGRGLIQNTGRANARSFTLWIRALIPDAPDFESEPALMEDFPWAAWTAIWFWTVKMLNVLADRDDLIGITRVINGGRNGLADRTEKLSRAKAALSKIAAEDLEKQQHDVVLYRGIRGHDGEVERVQRALRNAGHYFLAIDGDFGKGTENAVRTFQKSRGLLADGLVGKITGAALEPFINEDTP